MKIVVTGGIGSGKSNAAIMLAEKLQSTYVSIDEIVRDLYEDHRIIVGLVKMFGTFDRKEISEIVFASQSKLEELEAFFEPFVTERLKDYEDAYLDLVVEFPLYFEKGSGSIQFDVVISVSSYVLSRIARVIKRDQCGARRVEQIMARQVSDEYREGISDFVIMNNDGLRELEDSVDTLVPKLQSIKEICDQAFAQRPNITEKIIEAGGKPKPILSKTEAILSKLTVKYRKIGLVSGSFDPITLGHTWVIQKALDIVDEVVVAVAINHSKKQLFTPEERGKMIKDTLAECLTAEQFERVTVNYIKSDEMTVSYANHVGAKFIFRGLRNSTDFEYENQLNLIQKKIAPEIETILLMTPRELIEISSSLIKGALSLREWERIAEPYVSRAVLNKLREVANK